MSERIPPTVTREVLRHLPAEIKRVLLITNGSGKAPKGWVENRGAVHIGGGRWIIPIEREEEA